MAWADINIGKNCRPPADPVEIIARAIDTALAVAQRPWGGPQVPAVSVAHLAAATGMSHKSAHQRLYRLCRRGVIDRVATGFYACGTEDRAEWLRVGPRMAELFGVDLARAAAG